MSRRAILHIGTEKTGSTSIQRSIARNAELLRRHGFVHVGSDEDEAGKTAKSRTEWKDPSDPSWDALAAEIEEVADGESLIISNESLYRLIQGAPATRLAELLAGFDTQILLYVRDQADFLQSLVLQNQKKQGRSVDFSQPEVFERFVRRRNLNYFQICDRLEAAFGGGTVDARLFDRAALKDGDVVADFFDAIGFTAVDALITPERSNPSLTVEMAHALRVLGDEKLKAVRYIDLLDSALRLSFNGHGSKHFLSHFEVDAVRARYEGSNRKFAERFLTNAEEIPTPAVWVDPSSLDIEQAKIELLELASSGPRIAGRWTGGKNIGARIFADGWITQIDGRNFWVRFSEDEPEAVIRFRSPFRRSHERKDHVSVEVIAADPAGPSVPCEVTVNDTPLGQLSIPADPIVFDTRELEPDDLVVIRLEPIRGDSPMPDWFTGIEIRHL